MQRDSKGKMRGYSGAKTSKFEDGDKLYDSVTEAEAFARGAGFEVITANEGTVASRVDMAHAEFVLTPTNNYGTNSRRYFWRRVDIAVDPIRYGR